MGLEGLECNLGNERVNLGNKGVNGGGGRVARILIWN